MAIADDIIRVFPRRTKATPVDPLAFVGPPPLPAFRPEPKDVLAVHVSCAFTWDLPEARRLVRAWEMHYPRVVLGGPAAGSRPGFFTPGVYLKPGYVITSRGCPNRCGPCLVPNREGALVTLPVHDGWDLLDNNLLACPREHVEAVLDMLGRQPRPVKLTGGLEARLLEPWFVKRMLGLRLDIAYLAYDEPSQKSHVERAAKMILDAAGWCPGTARRRLSCYVLLAYDPADSVAAIVERLEWVKSLGVTPYAMWYRAPDPRKWPAIDAMKRELRRYMRPSAIYAAEGGGDG